MTTNGEAGTSEEVNPSFLARLDTLFMWLTLCWQVLFFIVINLPEGQAVLDTAEKRERLFNHTALVSLTVLPLILFTLLQILYYLIKGRPKEDDKKHFDDQRGWVLVWLIALAYAILKF